MGHVDRREVTNTSPLVLKKSQIIRVTAAVGVGLLLCFACLLTVHLAIAVGLLGRLPRWRGLVSLLPPLAPFTVYWALKESMYIRVALWGVSLAGYLLLLCAAYMWT